MSPHSTSYDLNSLMYQAQQTRYKAQRNNSKFLTTGVNLILTYRSRRGWESTHGARAPSSIHVLIHYMCDGGLIHDWELSGTLGGGRAYRPDYGILAQTEIRVRGARRSDPTCIPHVSHKNSPTSVKPLVPTLSRLERRVVRVAD